MTRIGCVVVAALLFVGAGCKKDEGESAGKMTEKEVKPPETKPPEPPPPETKPARKAPTTGEEVAAQYKECWGYFNDKKWDDFKACFAPDFVGEQVDSGTPPYKGPEGAATEAQAMATAFPDAKGEQQLTLVNGKKVVSITNFTGTHEGTLKGPAGDIPATHKKLNLPTAHLVEINDQGLAVKEWFIMDGGAFMGQLGLLPPNVPFRAEAAAWPEKQVVVAKNDDAEKKNVEMIQTAIDTVFGKHDAAAAKKVFADSLVWSEAAMPKDMSQKQMLDSLKDFFVGFPDAKMEITDRWGAGEYVVQAGTMSGTNTGKMKTMPANKTGKKMTLHFIEIDHVKDGKIDKGWLFYNGGAMAQQLGLMPPPK